MTERPQRKRSRLSGVHPAARHESPAKSPAPPIDNLSERLAGIPPEPEGSSWAQDLYGDESETGRLTIDVNRALRRDLKAWVGGFDGTIADAIRALAKLTLADQESPGRQECRSAILAEIEERRRREAARRQNG